MEREKEFPPVTEILFTKEEIGERVNELGKQITEDYDGKELVVIGVLTGACVFGVDLSRAVHENGKTDFEMDFMGISSYGSETEFLRNPELLKI
ncbi:phosphoribosyltransferase [Patescibacteria group bacterium]